MIVGDLVVGRIRACLGTITKPALKSGYFWVYWVTGGLRDKSTLESAEMLYLYDDEKDRKTVDWR